jgi:hypothetical protein
MRAKSFARRDKTRAKGQEIVITLLIFNVNTNIYTGKKPAKLVLRWKTVSVSFLVEPMGPLPAMLVH